jgi:hypothetical protein
MVFCEFCLDANGVLSLVAGSEIGSDFPEITWEDRDGDGRPEIYRKHRDWDKHQGYIEDRFLWNGERYELDLNYSRRVGPDGEQKINA